MPPLDFLIPGTENEKADDGDMEFEDDDELAGDDWILVDSAPKQQQFDQDYTQDRIARET